MFHRHAVLQDIAAILITDSRNIMLREENPHYVTKVVPVSYLRIRFPKISSNAYWNLHANSLSWDNERLPKN